MSSLRAYVAGEALWSRSQKNAVYFLKLYLHSGGASQFAQYQASLAVPVGDEFARWALERDPVEVELPASASCKAAIIPMTCRD